MEEDLAIGIWSQAPGQHGMDATIVRHLDADEFARYSDAIARYAELTDRSAFQLLQRNYGRLQAVLETYSNLSRVTGSLRNVNQKELGLILADQLANWLASTRTYIESQRDFVSHQFGESAELRLFDEARHRAFDGLAGYRFLYNLRDYAQHCNLPVSSLNISGSEEEPDRRFIELRISRSALLMAHFNWNRHAKALIDQWPEQISLMPLVDEAMAGYRDIEDELLRIVIRHCGESIAVLREGIASASEGPAGYPALFRLPSGAMTSLSWQSFPLLEGLEQVARALRLPDPLDSFRASAPVAPGTPEQRQVEARAAAVISVLFEDDDHRKFERVVNRIIEQDQSVVPLISGMANLCKVMVVMLADALGSTPPAIRGLFSEERPDEA
jgi:hypothetical protein